MAISESPICPSCGTWNVQVAYKAPGVTGATAREQLSGRCNTCQHEWSDEL